MKSYDHYTIFADLLRYPQEDYKDLALAAQQMLESFYPEAAVEMKPFADYVSEHSDDKCEELYTKTFDVQPICYLDLGYVIFGEDYKRGAFLLHMQEEQKKCGNDCGTDLSDNISNMLVMMSKTDNQALVDELVFKILIPGIEKMISEFKQARVDLKMKVLKKLHKAIIQEELNQGNVYKNVLSALLLVLKKDFENVKFDEVIDPLIDIQHHKSFFGKHSVNIEVNDLLTNYKQD